MRILQVIHQFPPYSSQGSEIYCRNLSKQLSETEDVRVFHISPTAGRWSRRLARESHAGLSTYHCVDGGEYSRLAAWPNAFLRKSFKTVLDEFDPQVVHFHNYLSLGDDLVSMARSKGTSVVFTLHDFGLICPNTFLFRTDGKLCTKDTSDFFQDCCPTLIRTTDRNDSPWNTKIPSLARWRLFARQHPQPLLRNLLLYAVRAGERLWGDPTSSDIPRKREFFFTHTRRIFQNVNLFLAPSQFLLARYVSCGLPAEKIAYTRYGMRRSGPKVRRATSPEIRFGYIGALHPQKGIELLLEAFKGLQDRASLHVHGSVFNSPVSNNYWRRISAQQPSTVIFHGGYDNDRINEIFETIDVIVVPSLWYENSPLTIQEAFIFGVPVITADSGGMAELVRHDVDGLHFRQGNPADLRQRMLEVVNEPGILDRLRKGIPPVMDIELHTIEVRGIYRKLLGSVKDE
jgi:glycosyltransferase involved in cell wall biosynthesis